MSNGEKALRAGGNECKEEVRGRMSDGQVGKGEGRSDGDVGGNALISGEGQKVGDGDGG